MKCSSGIPQSVSGAVLDFGESPIGVDSREGEAPAEPMTAAEMHGSAGASPSQFSN